MVLSDYDEQESRRLNVCPQLDPYAHQLKTQREGGSEVEKLAEKIEARRENRVPITFAARVEMLTTCREVAISKGYPTKNKIARRDLRGFYQSVALNVVQETQNGKAFIHHLFGLQTTQQYLLGALSRALREMDIDEATEETDWFFFQEFNFFHTQLTSKWPWMRNETSQAYIIVLLFFLATPLIFCGYVRDDNICDAESSAISWNNVKNGWYFASVTLSTVGYGDLTVDKADDWSVLVGTLYMIISICVSILAFSAAADDAFSPLDKFYNRFCRPHVDDDDVDRGEFLYKKIGRIKAMKLGEIIFQFVCLNMIGVLASRLFDGNKSNLEGVLRWTWLESFYWSVQSTTTIGYGDMPMSQNMQLFQVFYLSLGTYFVGNTLGKLQTLKTDIEALRRLYAWERREVSKGMLRSDQAENDGKIDQYEFVLSSLLILGKITSDDVKPIMSKFRKLSQPSGYIHLSEHNVGMDTGSNADADTHPIHDYKTF